MIPRSAAAAAGTASCLLGCVGAGRTGPRGGQWPSRAARAPRVRYERARRPALNAECMMQALTPQCRREMVRSDVYQSPIGSSQRTMTTFIPNSKNSRSYQPCPGRIGTTSSGASTESIISETTTRNRGRLVVIGLLDLLARIGSSPSFQGSSHSPRDTTSRPWKQVLGTELSSKVPRP